MSNIKNKVLSKEQETVEYEAQEMCRDWMENGMCDAKCEDCTIAIMRDGKVHYLNGITKEI